MHHKSGKRLLVSGIATFDS
ncbi:KxYKxGKxW signal peptide domain-containing protein [Zhongshania guokunii]|uniref:KxYKxGKxW signal peptide domain-containing protein n=1 Tax=Zhongshania guokunii TaxID=641783 RepID=A0ABV3U7A4_9GAMM